MTDKLKRSLEGLQKYAEQYNHWPTQKDWTEYAKKHGYMTFSSIYYHTKKNSEALRKEFGAPLKNRKYTEEECIQALEKASKFLGKSFTRRDYMIWSSDQDLPSVAQISRRCKSFNRAKELAGLVPNVTVRHNMLTDAELIAWLKRCYAETGGKFSDAIYEEWRKKYEDAPHVETIRTRLGGFKTLKQKLDMDGFDVGPQTKYAEGSWLAPFIDFLTDSLALEKYEKWAKRNAGPSQKALRDHAGGYERALVKALHTYIERVESGRKRRQKQAP